MNPCTRYVSMIGSRTGELSADERRALQEHLAGCAACRARVSDQEALAGILGEGLMAEASRRDFSTFSDEVIARIPAYTRPHERGLRAWARHHRRAFLGAILAPAAIAAALVLYFAAGPAEQHVPLIEVSAEGRGAVVLQTREGPVVLFGNDSEGT